MTMKDQVLYLFDPLCGWCYGFSENMLEFYQQHRTDFEFVAVPGGMVTGERVGPISKMEDYISRAYKQVEQTTGCRYGEVYVNDLLRSKTTVLDSEPPSRATITFRSFFPDRAVEFAHELQRSHFYDGKDYNDLKLYEELAARFQIDSSTFMQRFHDERMKQNLQQEFAWVSESGVQGYPTVVYRSGQKYYLIAHGYTSVEALNEALKKAQKMVASQS